mmetsp:Transcript_30378/g.65484  ORF Transcript_30378/g.65484 Transcript_30378/m.65484 type:complete len:201 (-) Transcript_30378:148-750(-)
MMSISMTTKLGLVCQARREQTGRSELARRAGVKPQTVSSWFRRAQRGLPLRETGGRPRKLDSVSHEKLLRYCALHHPVPLQHLKALIHIEYAYSQRRSNGLGELDDSMDGSPFFGAALRGPVSTPFRSVTTTWMPFPLLLPTSNWVASMFRMRAGLTRSVSTMAWFMAAKVMKLVMSFTAAIRASVEVSPFFTLRFRVFR